MANEYAVNQSDLMAVADSIRKKGGTSDALAFPDGFVDAVGAIQISGGSSSDDLEAFKIALCTGSISEFRSDIDVPISFGWARGMASIKRIYLPNCPGTATTNQWFAFSGAQWEEIYMPLAYRLGSRTFEGSKVGTQIDFPMLAEMGSQNFYGCIALTKARFGRADLGSYKGNIGTATFDGCTSLETIILSSTSKIWNLDNVNAFNNTPVASGTGYIYVPSALVEDYKVATNWATYADQIRAIEDYPEITGG